ncbi:MAG: hypothetical protein AABN33_26185, partial [Acidobacteriota bacterium]
MIVREAYGPPIVEIDFTESKIRDSLIFLHAGYHERNPGTNRHRHRWSFSFDLMIIGLNSPDT